MDEAEQGATGVSRCERAHPRERGAGKAPYRPRTQPSSTMEPLNATMV